MSPRQSSKELELKLLASPEDQAGLANCGLVARYATGPGQEKQLAQRVLRHGRAQPRRAGYSLRVRDDGKTYVQTLKFAPPEEKSFSRTNGKHPSRQQARCFTPAGLRDRAGRGAARRKSARACLLDRGDRQTIPLSFKGTKLELAFDQGAIAAGGCERPVSEIEIELQKGEAARLYELALALLDLAPLRWSTASKFERGHALARATPPPTSPAPSSALASSHAR